LDFGLALAERLPERARFVPKGSSAARSRIQNPQSRIPMKLTNLAIDNRTTILVLTVLLTLGGLLSYLTIPKEAQPSIEIPYIVVTTVYPGASPDDVESLITQHIEREVQSVAGIKEIRSTSTEGVSSVIIEFNPDVSTDDAFQKVRD